MPRKSRHIKIDDGQALMDAINAGEIEQAKRLIPETMEEYTKIGFWESSKPLRRAARSGYLELVQQLIPLCNPKDLDSEALYVAVCQGHLECVKALIPVSDVSASRSRALHSACLEENIAMMELLLPHSDISMWTHKEVPAWARAWIEAKQQKEHLSQTLSHNPIPLHSKPKL